MSDIQKRAIDFFESMDRDKFINLLVEAGFEVEEAEDGEGGVIFEDGSIL